MGKASKVKGNWGELFASEFLVGKGYRIVTTNYFAKVGEIDIVAKDPNDIWVFVEVKSYKKGSPVHPLEAITPTKQKRLIKTAMMYMIKELHREVRCRFDCISIVGGTITHHIEDAFGMSGS